MSDTNGSLLPQKLARCLKFCTEEVEGLYYLCSENKGTDQLQLLPCSWSLPLFSHRRNAGVSHDVAYFVI